MAAISERYRNNRVYRLALGFRFATGFLELSFNALQRRLGRPDRRFHRRALVAGDGGNAGCGRAVGSALTDRTWASLGQTKCWRGQLRLRGLRWTVGPGSCSASPLLR